jgi:hypothetical protein
VVEERSAAAPAPVAAPAAVPLAPVEAVPVPAAPPPAVALERSLSSPLAQRDTAVRDVRPLETLPLASPLQPMALPLPAAALPSLPRSPAPQALQPAPPLAAAPSRLTAPELPALPALAASPLAPGPATLPGTPDAGSRVGQDVATPAAAAASAPPRLNLQLARPRGGELSRWGSTAGALPVLPRPPELPDKFGRDVEKSAKPDCRSAYSGFGVLAPVPLVADALRKEGGCKW